MQQLRRNRVSRAISYLLVAALLAPQGLVCLPVQAQTAGQSVPAVAVVPFQDLTGQAGPTVMREVTAAAALALEDAREFIVISTTDLDREMAALRLKPPLGTPEQIRLGSRLHADKVLVGSLTDLKVDAATGRARATLRLMLLDVAIGEYLDGAVASIETKAIPGFSGDVAAVTNEALRQVADAAVAEMLGSSVRRGTVELVDDLGNVNINLGTSQGLDIDSELLVMRPTWQPDVERVIMRRVGIIRVTEIESNMAVARAIEGSIPTTGDRIYRVYKPVAAQAQESRERKFKSGAQLIAGIALLFGLVAVATGPTTASGSSLECALAQARPGADPEVLLTVNTGQTALSRTHGWLFFRHTTSNFPAVAQYLIDAVRGQRLPNNQHSDEPFEYRVVEDFEITFEFLEEDSLEEGSVTVAYNDPPLVRGTRYYYRVQRVVEPLGRPGENPPIATAQIEPTDPEIEADPDSSVLSEPSNSCGPVTFFTPPVLSLPANGAPSERTDAITFTWQPSVGANEYVVQVFPSDDPDGIRAPILQSTIIRDSGSSVLNATIRNFSPGTYWWRVGARASGDPERPINLMTGEQAWLYSSMRTFSTVQTPPPVPGSAAGPARPSNIPGRHGGWWGSDRRSR